MTDPALLVALGSAGILAVGATSAAALKGWQEWLEVKRLEMEGGRPRPAARAAGAPVEISDLRGRVRRLEAIANGGDLER